jgi:hypothetical protein
VESSDLGVDLGLDVCGLELFAMDGEVAICGKPGSLWGLVDKPGWERSQIVACNEHHSVLHDDPAVTVTSNMPIVFPEDECTCN